MQEQELRKGPWLEEEDEQLAASVAVLGNRKWDSLAKASGLRRSGKSCRLRWMNYLRPNLKHGRISEDEERVIVELHEKLGNKWSKIAQRLPGRTDNEIKNYWRGYSKKKAIVQQGSCNKTMNTASNISPRTECHTAKVEIFGNSTDDLEQFDLACSPYETRLGELILNSPCDTSKSDHANELWNYDIPNTDWVYNDYASNIWDIPLWEGY